MEYKNELHALSSYVLGVVKDNKYGMESKVEKRYGPNYEEHMITVNEVPTCVMIRKDELDDNGDPTDVSELHLFLIKVDKNCKLTGHELPLIDENEIKIAVNGAIDSRYEAIE